jgi:tight adherence protein C
MLTLTAILIFLFCFLITLPLYLRFQKTEQAMAVRVAAFLGGEGQASLREEELRQPLYYRLVKPFLSRLGSAGKRYLSSGRAQAMETRLAVAGNPGGLGAAEFMVVKYFASGFVGAVGLLFGWLLGMLSSKLLFYFCVFAAIGFIAPDFYVKRRAQARQTAVLDALPDTIDLITVSVEAGLGFDGALLKVVEKMKGVLPDELRRVLQEVKVGKTRKDALRDMALRLNLDDLSTFVGAVIMAESMGVQLSNVMRIQSQEMRSRRRQRAEEAAMKAPVKMLLPLVMFIFPATFVILLGPAMIKITRVFQ